MQRHSKAGCGGLAGAQLKIDGRRRDFRGDACMGGERDGCLHWLGQGVMDNNADRVGSVGEQGLMIGQRKHRRYDVDLAGIARGSPRQEDRIFRNVQRRDVAGEERRGRCIAVHVIQRDRGDAR